MQQQKGFTLIELIVVIVILGILAATALPKFVNLSTDARAASVMSLEGSMRAASAMVYGKAQINNQSGATGSISLDGGVTSISLVYGYPSTVADLIKAMDLNTTTYDYTTVVTEIELKGATTPASCKTTYAAATATLAPVIASTTTGC